MKEISPSFYDAVSMRLGGISTTVQTYDLLLSFIKGLPPYFKDWPEYIDYLIDNLISTDFAEKMKKTYQQSRKRFLSQATDAEQIEYVETKLGHAAAVCVVKADHNMRHLSNANFVINKELKCRFKNK
jgi:predicted phosphoadenosine phosphosulfate sulfurtransferase